MVTNPFTKKENFAQKVTKNVHLPHIGKKKSTKEKVAEFLQFSLIYVAFFIAGFVLSKIHTLLTVVG